MMQPTVSGPKDAGEFLRDYAISSLILTAKFGFKPVVGNTYYLYTGEKGWTLSLISPNEWGQSSPGEFLASCRLRIDMTWEMSIDELAEDSDALARAREFIHGFVDVLCRTGLNFYASSLLRKSLALLSANAWHRSGIVPKKISARFRRQHESAHGGAVFAPHGFGLSAFCRVLLVPAFSKGARRRSHNFCNRCRSRGRVDADTQCLMLP